MPGATPNFAIPYPCAGETIDPTVFQDFADGVEQALTDVQNAADETLNRPVGSLRTATAGTSTAVGVTTAMTYSTTEFLTGGLVAIANGFTTPTGGVWMVTAQFSGLTTVTSVTSWAGEIQAGGVVQYRRKQGYNVATTNADFINVSGLVYCAAACNITGHFVWTGSGGPLFAWSRISIAKLCDL